MRDNVHYRWFRESLRPDQKKDYDIALQDIGLLTMSDIVLDVAIEAKKKELGG